jgi:ParB family chromosome partitioning protein
MGHARALLPLEGAQQMLLANEIVARKLSVREAEKLVARAGSSRQRSPRAEKNKPRDVARIEEQLSDALTAKVEIRVKKGGTRGAIAIAFASFDELDGLLEKLNVTKP